MKSILENPIRKKILELRKALPKDEVTRLSQEVSMRFLKFFDIENFSRPLFIGCYRAFQSELDPSFLEPALRKKKWRVSYPRVSARDSKKLEFIEISETMDPQLSWKISPYGFHEPHPELAPIRPENLDLIIIPGVGFGESGERMGRGAGHYDRFLPEAPHALRVGLAYDFQVLPKLEMNSWDQPVHWIITEKREFKTPFVNSWMSRVQGLGEGL